ncbi:MAG: sigma-54-dependent Fis family transcriptional regulator [Bacteroidales bacterium]|nr:sigma-54-dependent Fis family transcriptional regulator [Bacteroidales bacterium]
MTKLQDMNIQQVKLRYGIIGNSSKLNHALEIALQVAQTDLSVLITGESGTGKEIFSQVIHTNSSRKHNSYIAVNCGAIPQGTIDSELFGHEKGSFTGAHESRKGYFEVANNGTIFLDEVAELPLSTQVRLLRVLESGEYIRVGSSKPLKTDVRVIAATNVDFSKAIQKGDFREDLYYRLSTVPIHIPPLRERGEDIYLLFMKFATDFAEKYQMPSVRLTDAAKEALISYAWQGNVRQLKNVTEQISIIEEDRNIGIETLTKYLKGLQVTKLPVLYQSENQQDFSNEREILFKFLFDIKKDVDETKKAVNLILQQGGLSNMKSSVTPSYNLDSDSQEGTIIEKSYEMKDKQEIIYNKNHIEDTEEIIDVNLSLADMEKDFILKALNKHKGKRKLAAEDLGISERTLYRKIKEYDIDM